MPRLLAAIVAAVVTAAVLSAQSPADALVRLEQERSDAIRDGQNAARFYSPAYRGINALGQYDTREQTIGAEARRARTRDFSVDVHGDAAIVTGIDTLGDTGERERVLRIWTREGGLWAIVAAQTTWIGARTGVPPPSGPLPNTVDAFTPRGRDAEALWTSQDALMRSFSEADPASYRRFSTDKSLRLTTGGDAIAREQWLDTIAKRAKGPLAIVDETRIAIFGEVGLVTLRGHEANPTRQSWVYLKEDGVWKLHLRYTTLIRNENSAGSR
jgi:hypothetical protein